MGTGVKIQITNTSRQIVGSMFVYSPRPPHTPPIFRSYGDLTNFLFVIV